MAFPIFGHKLRDRSIKIKCSKSIIKLRFRRIIRKFFTEQEKSM